MRRLVALLGLLAVLATAGALPVSAQDEVTLEVLSADVDAHPEVSLTVAAPQEFLGTPLTDVDFRVAEDGAQRPAAVTPLRNDVLQVVLLVDTSGSMAGQPIEAVRQAANDFVAQMPDGVSLGVVGFDSAPRVVSSFTRDHATATEAIDALDAGGRTALYDGVAEAVGLFDSEPDGRRVIVLISDGEDNNSSATIEEATGLLDGGDVTLNVVELRTRFSDAAALERLAGAGDGEVVSIDDPGALSGIYDTIASKLVNQYRLAYRSEAHGLTEVSIELSRDQVQGNAVEVLSLPDAPKPAAPDEAVTVPGPPQEDTLHVLAVDATAYPIVEVTVVAPRSLAERELETAAFDLFETGRPQSVEVRRLGGTDLEIVLALDTSGSMRGRAMEEARAAAWKFIDRIPEDARMGLVTFATEPRVDLPLTDDRAALREAVDAAAVGGHTALYDAAVLASGFFDPDTSTSRTVVLLSDGGDTSSATSLQEAAEQLARARVGLHVVELVTPETDRPAMEELLEPSGGLIVSATDPAGLALLLDEVATDVMNQYVLRYESTSRGLVELEVGVAEDGVAATARKAVDLPPPPPVQSFLGSRWGLYLGAAAMYLALMLVILLILAPRAPRVRLAGKGVRAGGQGSGVPAMSELAQWASAKADQALRHRGRDRSLNAAMERAGINLRPGEFLVFVVSLTVVSFALGLLVFNALAGVAFALLTSLGSRLVVSMLAGRRQAAFADQLGDTLQLLAGSLRAGYSVLQAIDAVSQEADSPTRDEFRRLVVENRLGRDFHETLRTMAERTGSEDFRWVVQAIEIHREVGGNLADVLDTVAGTIRERNQIRRQIKTLSAEGRISAWILLALPFVVAGGAHLVAPTYLPIMFESRVGIAMLVGSAVFMVFGALWLRRIVRVVF